VRVLTAKWDTASRISPADGGVVTGESTGDEAEAPKVLADKPLFIYVTDGAGEEGFDKIEKVILDDNKILVGMKAFKCVKMTTEDVANDPLLSGKSKDDRYFLFVSRDYEDVKAVDGSKLKTNAVYSMMKRFAQREYKTKFEKTVKATLKLLVEYDKINNAKKVIEAKKQREGDDLSKGEAAKIEKELAELEERQKKNEELEKELLKWELKSA
jgi:dGTP triphosphohydrolase